MADEPVPLERKPLRGQRTRRPWPENVFELICQEYETTSTPITRICDRHLDWPSFLTISVWMENDEGLARRYARAKRVHAQFLVDEAQEIADNKEDDLIETPKGVMPNPVAVNRDRLRVDVRRWTAGKLSAEFADKVQVSGGGGLSLTQVFAMPANGRDALPPGTTEVIEGEAKVKLPSPPDDDEDDAPER